MAPFHPRGLPRFVDALRLAGDVGDLSRQMRCQWVVMSLDGGSVKASCGLSVLPDGALRDPTAFDYLVVSSGLVTGIAAASSRLEQNLSAPLSMKQLSERLNTSERHLERIFAGSFGQSPSRVYRTLRLRFGGWLLQNTQDTVTSIALKCGYADASHFTRQFQCEFRATPTEERNRRPARAKKAAAQPLDLSIEPAASPAS